MPKYGYLVVEGPHDVEFVYRLLAPFGLKRVQLMEKLDTFMQILVPRSFPYGGDLLKRVPVPVFLQSDSHVIAVHNAGGDSRLVPTLQETSTVIDFGALTGVGIVLDTDKQIPVFERYTSIKQSMQEIGHMLPDSPGAVSDGMPRLGAFVLPDNESEGNLEDLLIECAESAYPNLLVSAMAHVNTAINDQTLKTDDGEDLAKIPVRNKAIVGTIASVLRPGKAVQVSIQDNRWLRDNNLNLDRIKTVQTFFASLLDLDLVKYH